MSDRVEHEMRIPADQSKVRCPHCIFGGPVGSWSSSIGTEPDGGTIVKTSYVKCSRCNGTGWIKA